MTNNEPLGGNLNDDGNANGTASSAAHPVDAADLPDSGKTSGQYDDVDFSGSDADGGSHAAGGNGAPHAERADAGTDAFGAGTAGVGDGTTGLSTGATGAGGVGSGATGLGSDSAGNGSPAGSSATSNGSPSGSSAAGTGGSNLGDLGDPAHPFDQTNGIVEGLEGDSDEADADAGDTTPA
jgi:hypothetical protein